MINRIHNIKLNVTFLTFRCAIKIYFSVRTVDATHKNEKILRSALYIYLVAQLLKKLCEITFRRERFHVMIMTKAPEEPALP